MFGVDLAHIAWLGSASLLAGAATGVLAGMFGVGGGTVIVPALYELFGLYGVPDPVRMPLCVGTSLAIIVPTSISSFRGHLRKGAVEKPILKIWAGPVVVGVIIGAALAAHAAPIVFKAVFVVICALLATKFLLDRPSWRLGASLPHRALLASYRFGIGSSAALMGIGGGLVANLVLTLYGMPIKKAVATASGVGVLVSLPGTLGYALAGWGRGDLPPFSLGYVSLIPFALLTPVSVFATRWGVALAHDINKRRLEVAFAIYLLVISLRFLAAIVGR